MALWFAALLGLVQGLTEFIPVSSTAHLRIVSALIGQHDAGGATYTAVIQLGTLLAVLAYFAKDLIALPAAMVRAPSSPEGRLPWLIARRHRADRDRRPRCSRSTSRATCARCT